MRFRNTDYKVWADPSVCLIFQHRNYKQMKIEFKGGFISADNDEDEAYYSVGISEDEFYFENHILFCRSYSEDEDEYVEVNDQAYGGYGICKKVVLSENKMEATLTINKEEWQVIVDMDDIKISDQGIEYLKFILGNKIEII